MRLIFKRYDRGTARAIDIAVRTADCVPRPSEFVCLNDGDGSVLVDHVEYIMTETENKVWVWIA